MFNRPAGYRVYLLRFWPGPSDLPGAVAWRFSLEEPRTGERRGFVGLDALVACLQAEVSAASGPNLAPLPAAQPEADKDGAVPEAPGHHDR